MADPSMPAHSEPASSRSGPGDDEPPVPAAAAVVSVLCAVGDAEALTDLAWVHGATGVAETTSDTEPDSVRLIVGADGPVERARLLAVLTDDPRCASATTRDADDGWIASWRSAAEPQRAGPVTIRLDDHDPDDALIDVVIEPGPSFGYGHVTTLVALELLVRHQRPAGHVVDLGTGSGVLAIVAALSGAATVTAIDTELDAVVAARANAERNSVAVDVRHGDARSDPIPCPAGGFDLILVNVTAAIQVALAPVIATVAAPGAQVVVSGILAHQEAAVRAAYRHATVDDRLERDGWVGLVVRHPEASRNPQP